jgi:tetratricopeptide (TPR) repeat protein
LAEGIARRLWGQALSSFESSRWDEAEIQFAESLKVLESGQNRLEAARTQRAWGLLCYERGDLAPAREHWQKAAALFEASSLTRELEEVRELLERDL